MATFNVNSVNILTRDLAGAYTVTETKIPDVAMQEDTHPTPETFNVKLKFNLPSGSLAKIVSATVQIGSETFTLTTAVSNLKVIRSTLSTTYQNVPEIIISGFINSSRVISFFSVDYFYSDPTGVYKSDSSSNFYHPKNTPNSPIHTSDLTTLNPSMNKVFNMTSTPDTTTITYTFNLIKENGDTATRTFNQIVYNNLSVRIKPLKDGGYL